MTDLRPTRRPAELPERVRVIVLFGGQSAEHEVSRVSAANVVSALDPRRYDIVPIGIGRDGTWMLSERTRAELDAGNPLDTSNDGLETGGPAMDVLPELQAAADSDVPTVVLPVLHGPNGEDGTMQGLLELSGVAYVGSGVLGSAVAMDKAMAKMVLSAAGLPQARYHSAARWDLTEPLIGDIIGDLGYPLFIKPANMGSSVGVSKAGSRAEVLAGIEAALIHDEILVFEETIVGRELEIGVLGNELPRVSVPGEIIPAAEFYDYDDKYRDGAAKTIVPADLDAELTEAMGKLAISAFRALRAEGLARVDMFLEEGGRGFLVNEINTFPGFTPISMFPMLWNASGLSYSELLDEMIRLALDRHQRRGPQH